MAIINFSTSYAVNPKPLVLSIEDFKKKFLHGLPLSKDGQPIPDVVYEQILLAVQDRLEEYLQLKLTPQVYVETKHFWNEDWQSWGYIPTQFPVVKPLEIAGFLGTVRQTLYPENWLSARQTSDGQYLHRMLYLVPSQAASHQQAYIFQGIIPNISYRTTRQIPNYWHIAYITGFGINQLPHSILQVMGKLASIDLLTMASDMLMSYPGVASTSISLDGLSQTISTVASGQNGLFGARIKQYGDDLIGQRNGQNGELKRLYDTYSAIPFGVA